MQRCTANEEPERGRQRMVQLSRRRACRNSFLETQRGLLQRWQPAERLGKLTRTPWWQLWIASSFTRRVGGLQDNKEGAGHEARGSQCAHIPSLPWSRRALANGLTNLVISSCMKLECMLVNFLLAEVTNTSVSSCWLVVLECPASDQVG